MGTRCVPKWRQLPQRYTSAGLGQLECRRSPASEMLLPPAEFRLATWDATERLRLLSGRVLPRTCGTDDSRPDGATRSWRTPPLPLGARRLFAVEAGYRGLPDRRRRN